jgi:Ca-activated chloride channel homolog
MMHRWLHVVPAVALLVAATQETRPAAQVRFRTTSDLVAVTVTVQKHDGSFVRGLSAGDFRVLDNGNDTPITLFGGGDVPVDLTLMIDTSVSMTNRLDAVQHAASVLVNSLTPRDRATIYSFGGRISELVDFSSNHAQLNQSIRKLRVSGTTRLYDAMYIALAPPAASSNDLELRRRAIVVFSDGDDTASLVSYETVLERAREAGVTIYIVVARLDQTAKVRIRNSDYEMGTLARETGGRVFFPIRGENLDAVYASIAKELRYQYSLGFVPQSADEDDISLEPEFIPVDVTVAMRDTVLRFRRGYVRGDPMQLREME